MAEVNTNIKENKESKPENKIMSYKGKPLVRKGSVISFGDVKEDKYTLMLEIKETKQENGIDAASKVFIAIKDTEDDSFVKFGEKDSLYDAFEIGEIWLALAEAGK